MTTPPISDYGFEAFLGEEKLMGSTCGRCGATFVPPRPMCAECHHTEMQWTGMKGAGRLVALTSISIGPPAMQEEGFDRENPYCTGVVKLDEGPRVVARIEGVDARNPASIEIGVPVTAVYLHRGEGEDRPTQLAFRPV
ncbi:MAG: Zn-ribbon domain-containing OB-fold protein [Gemmatimonadota bacterium]|nr:Zn-ribbon domain-containing OB-fold protein [Gemmatimonadota bacterium]